MRTTEMRGGESGFGGESGGGGPTEPRGGPRSAFGGARRQAARSEKANACVAGCSSGTVTVARGGGDGRDGEAAASPLVRRGVWRCRTPAGSERTGRSAPWRRVGSP